MLYDLSNPLGRKQFSTYVKKLWESESKVELKKYRENRTLKQNAYLHLILTWYGFELGYTVEEVKQDIFKREICKDFFIKEKKGRTVFKSTRDLDTLEMTQAIEKFRNHAADDMGIYLPAPNEMQELNSMEHQLKQYGTREFVS